MDTKEFYELSREQRAVLVAKDVIAQINAKKYIPINGTYVELTGNKKLSGQIKDKFKEVECKVCALGATIMSCTHLGNKLTFEELINDSHGQSMKSDKEIPSVSELLSNVFDPHNLLLIEMAFEGYHSSLSEKDFKYNGLIRYAHHFGQSLSREECMKCEEFHDVYTNVGDEDECFDDDEGSADSENRLIAIMENIIKNNGNFII